MYLTFHDMTAVPLPPLPSPPLHPPQLFYPVLLKDLFLPSFLLVWPARQSFSVALVLYMQRKYTRMFNPFRYKAISLMLFLAAFIFTW